MKELILTPDNIKNICTIEDFVDFLIATENDYKLNKDEWQNTSLDRYFEAMAAWIKDAKPQIDNLNSVAKILYMGKIYE